VRGEQSVGEGTPVWGVPLREEHKVRMRGTSEGGWAHSESKEVPLMDACKGAQN
jgi:hypothetical protein